MDTAPAVKVQRDILGPRDIKIIGARRHRSCGCGLLRASGRGLRHKVDSGAEVFLKLRVQIPEPLRD